MHGPSTYLLQVAPCRVCLLPGSGSHIGPDFVTSTERTSSKFCSRDSLMSDPAQAAWPKEGMATCTGISTPGTISALMFCQCRFYAALFPLQGNRPRAGPALLGLLPLTLPALPGAGHHGATRADFWYSPASYTAKTASDLQGIKHTHRCLRCLFFFSHLRHHHSQQGGQRSLYGAAVPYLG